MAIIHRYELRPTKPLGSQTAKAEKWSDLPRDLKEKLLLEAIKGKVRGSHA